MLEVSNIYCRQGQFQIAADNIRIPAKEIHCLMGKSGSGKSTFLLALSGFLPLESGRIQINNVDVHSLPPEKRQIALVFQRSCLFPKLSVFENIAFALRIKKKPETEIRARVRELSDKLKIAHLLDRFPHQISGGEAQRVALARALAPKFPILLLDEPFTGLDVELREELRQLLRSLVLEEGVSALIVTHDPEDAKFFGTRLYQIVNGKISG